MITIIKLSNDTKELPIVVSNWSELKDHVKEFMLAATDYRVMNSQEMLLYNGRQILASCSIDVMEDNKLYIENCWTDQGNIF
jgi:hypothetical protein